MALGTWKAQFLLEGRKHGKILIFVIPSQSSAPPVFFLTSKLFGEKTVVASVENPLEKGWQAFRISHVLDCMSQDPWPVWPMIEGFVFQNIWSARGSSPPH